MFSDSNAADRDCVNFASNWRREKNLRTNDCQTEPMTAFDQESQVSFLQDGETQTDHADLTSTKTAVAKQNLFHIIFILCLARLYLNAVLRSEVPRIPLVA